MRARREFPASVKKARLKHAQNRCEECSMPLRAGFHFDHDVPDGLGGEPTFENCRVLCTPCHKIKTHEHDRPRMQKADNVRAKHQKTRARRARRSRAVASRKPRSRRSRRFIRICRRRG
jgi:5-methylcytosine-specific restriction protein A